nr:nuclease domain-containing protein [Paraburkholderia sp. J8-2]
MRPAVNDADYAPEYEPPIERKPDATNARYLAACRGEQCYLRVSGICQARGWGSETVVPCHSNQPRHGKGMGIKAADVFTVPGCWACHAWLDQNHTKTPRAAKHATWDRAYSAWEPVRREKLGIMEIPEGITV